MTSTLFDDLMTEVDATNAPKAKKVAAQLPRPDPLADTLIKNGFAHSAGLLDINGSLSVKGDVPLPYPWNLPSRLFGFPIEIGRQENDGTRTMTLRHPLLADHPYVKRVEAALGVRIEPDTEPDNLGQWWHSVDLISSGHWRDLLDTSRFTTPEPIAGAVAFGLQYSAHESKKRNGHISTAEAREIMAFLEIPEPADRDSIIRERFMSPSPVKEDKGTERWPVNYMGDQNAVAWGMILAIECGFFAHDRAGFLGWTKAGRERFPPEERPAPESTLGNVRTKMTDEIAPRPTAMRDMQLDLF